MTGITMLAQQRRVPPLVQFVDALAGITAVVAAVALSSRTHAGVSNIPEAFRLNSAVLNLPTAAIFGWAWHVCLTHRGLYERNIGSTPILIGKCAGAVSQMAIAFAVLYLASHGFHGLRRAVLFFAALSFLIELVRTTLLSRVVRFLFEQKEAVLILGTGRRAQKAWRDLRVGNHFQITFAGFANDCDLDELPPDIRERFATRIADLPAFLQANHVDVLIVATSLGESFSLTREAIAVAEAFDLRVLCLEDALELGRSTVPTGTGSVFSEVINHHRRSSSLLAIKNVMDRLLASMLLLLSVPLQLCCGLAVLASGARPIWITSRRYGYHRRPFEMFSLNTRLGRPLADRGAPELAGLTAEADSAETRWPERLGALLRWTYLDRLPRLLNVVKGDMTLIGPEAFETTGTSPLEDPDWGLAFTAKPGLLRPSHLIARSVRCEANAIKADSLYLASWSIRKDAELLYRIFLDRCVSLVLMIRGSLAASAATERNQPVFGAIPGDVNE